MEEVRGQPAGDGAHPAGEPQHCGTWFFRDFQGFRFFPYETSYPFLSSHPNIVVCEQQGLVLLLCGPLCLGTLPIFLYLSLYR